MKTAVILFNLGGPDSRAAIRPFLLNFFMDPNIIRAPYPVRWFIARLIANRRSKREAGDSYALLGDRSPLLENTQAQARALEARLGADYRVFVCMRYWHPMADEVAGQVKAYNPDRVILLPLYPQFSTTTTRSALQSWNKAAVAIGLEKPARMICCYPIDGGFVTASATLIRDAVMLARQKTGREPRVLFSAHGLPEDVIRDGDPYQHQCEESARAMARAAGLSDWVICYQSRVGPKKWIGPSTEEAIEAAAKDRVPVVIYPHAFTQEHVETLVEIEIEYRHKAEALGLDCFIRVPTVSVQDAFIDGLAALAQSAQGTGITGAGGVRQCPKNYARCCMGEGRLV